MAKRFEFLEHTADIGLVAHGNSMEDCFANAAIGMFHVMTDTNKVKKKIRHTIEAKGTDDKSLLYQWLEQLLHLLGKEGFLLAEVEFITIKGSALQATVLGDLIEHGYETHGEVKAVTYNEMDIKKNPYQVTVVLDI